MKKKYLLLLFPLLIGCSKKEPQPLVFNHNANGYFYNDEFIFPMNTLSSIQYYDNNFKNDIENNFDEIITYNSKLLDRYHHYDDMSNLYDLNNLKHLENINDNLYNCIKLSYDLTILTEGKFNMFMGEIIDLYAESIDNSDPTKMPNNNEILNALSNIPSYTNIDEVISFEDETNSVTICKYNNNYPIISLGGIAKGFIGDLLLDYYKNKNYSYIINLGSSTISTSGTNPNKEGGKYSLGFRLPNLNASTIELTNTISIGGNYNLSTSGDYENCYLYDNNSKLMHHIINPYTGYSNNTYRSVSLISNTCSLAILDALSTSVFNCNNDDETIELIDLFNTTYNTNIDYMCLKPLYENELINFDKYTLLISEGFNNLISGTYNNKIVL